MRLFTWRSISASFLCIALLLTTSNLSAVQKEKGDKQKSKKGATSKILKDVRKALDRHKDDLDQGKREQILDMLEMVLGDKEGGNHFFFKSDGEFGDLKELAEKFGKDGMFELKLGDGGEQFMFKSKGDIKDLAEKFEFAAKPKKMVGISLNMEQDDDNVTLTVEEVMDDSAAEEAGLEKGDIILAVNGDEVDDLDVVLKAIENTKEKEAVEFEIERDGKTMEIKVVPKMQKQPKMDLNREFKFVPKGEWKGNKFEFVPNGKWDGKDFQFELPEGFKGGEFKFEIPQGAWKGKNLENFIPHARIIPPTKQNIFIPSGGDRLDELQKQLDALKKELKELKKQ